MLPTRDRDIAADPSGTGHVSQHVPDRVVDAEKRNGAGSDASMDSGDFQVAVERRLEALGEIEIQRGVIVHPILVVLVEGPRQRLLKKMRPWRERPSRKGLEEVPVVAVLQIPAANITPSENNSSPASHGSGSWTTPGR